MTTVYSNNEPIPESVVIGQTTAFVQAVPVNNETSQPAVVEGYLLRPPINDLERQGLENQFVGVCRRCRRQFQRPPGVNDGQASYYRCAECNNLRGQDLLASCTIV